MMLLLIISMLLMLNIQRTGPFKESGVMIYLLIELAFNVMYPLFLTTFFLQSMFMYTTTMVLLASDSALHRWTPIAVSFHQSNCSNLGRLSVDDDSHDHLWVPGNNPQSQRHRTEGP